MRWFDRLLFRFRARYFFNVSNHGFNNYGTTSRCMISSLDNQVFYNGNFAPFFISIFNSKAYVIRIRFMYMTFCGACLCCFFFAVSGSTLIFVWILNPSQFWFSCRDVHFFFYEAFHFTYLGFLLALWCRPWLFWSKLQSLLRSCLVCAQATIHLFSFHFQMMLQKNNL